MSSIYRCKCRVAYRPYGSSIIIPFDEKQIVSATMDMKWDANPITLNTSTHTETSQFVQSLSASTVNVTLTDPYMTGAAWAVLFDTAAAYTTSSDAAANNIILPKCEPGQDPLRDKCRNYPDFDDPNLRASYLGNFAHILIKFYYTVNGINFGLDAYFRLQGFSISHGKTYPKVSLRGVDPQTMIFNQSLDNFQLAENKTIEENLEKVFNDYGQKVSFCNGPDADYSKQLITPVAFKEKNVTVEEVAKKYLKSVGGNYLKLPLKEFANKVSICTRANVNQGCSVFYLGKGLYEGYDITGGVNPDQLNLNFQGPNSSPTAFEKNNAQLVDEAYKLQDLFPERRKTKLKDAKTTLGTFPEQFTLDGSKKLSSTLVTSGYVWEGAGPEVKNTKKDKINLYGINVNGTEPISFLDGVVEEVSRSTGRVLIKTNYFLRICKRGDNKDCLSRPIYQEVVGIDEVGKDIKPGGKLKVNQGLGKSKTDFTRFYFLGVSRTESFTLSPQIVWNFANPVEGLSPEQKQTQAPQLATPNSPSLASQAAGIYVGRVGNTGNSTAPHIHLQWVNGKAGGSEERLSQVAATYIRVDGRPLPSFSRSRGYQSNHSGIDYGIEEGKEITIINGASVARVGETRCRDNIDTGCGGGFGNFVDVSTPEGVVVIAHLLPDSLDSVFANGQRSGSGPNAGVQGAPSPVGAELTTEFRGVPRALRIIPGRTVLSFITQYDEWIEQGRPESIDPGIWIPERFSKWFIRGVSYRWTGGDLRVSLSAVTDWGNTTAKVPSPKFPEYLESFGKDFAVTKDYYGYIRSLGDLCWRIKNQTSCEVICDEAERLRQFFSTATAPQSPGAGQSYPAADCKYAGSYQSSATGVMNEIMGALKAVGINTAVAYAGVLGNIDVESTFNFNVHNGPRPGGGCGRTPSRVLGTVGYGLPQWCGSRADELAATGCGRNCSQQQQLNFLVNEIKTGRNISPSCQSSNWIAQINGASSPQAAADLWNKCYERGPGGIVKRQQSAAKIFPGLRCNKIQ